uniref:Uncharacterized protein n=1 Tax=Chaetoceros debilis TaxID=122233 RepID=A0A6S8XJK0_9STRA
MYIQATDMLLDKFAVSRIEEDILLDLVDRQINVSNSIQDSVVKTSGKRLLAEGWPMPARRKKSSKSRSASTSPREKAKANEENHSTSRTKNPSKQPRDYAKASILVPKFVGETKEEILNDYGLTLLVERIYEGLTVAESKNKKLFDARIAKDRSQKDTIMIRMKGRKDLLEAAKGLIEKVTSNKVAEHNVKKLSHDQNSIEVDIKIDATKEFGVKFRKGETGLWIESISPGQFLDITRLTTDPSITIGAAISHMWLFGRDGPDGKRKKISKLKEKNKIMRKAKSEFELTGFNNNKFVGARIVFPKDCDLSRMNVEKYVIKGHIFCRNGTVPAFYRKIKAVKNILNKQRRPSITNQSAKSKYGNAPTRRPSSSSWNDKTVPPSSARRFQPKHSQVTLSNGRNIAATSSANSQSSSLRKRRSSEGVEIIEESAEVKKRPKVQTDKSKSFTYFAEKIKEIKETEFGGGRAEGRVHLQFALSSMWNSHKTLIGELCDENCQCGSRISELTDPVVGEYILRGKKKDKNWQVPPPLRYSAGLTKYFCPKFYPKVRSTFPILNDSQILSKLVEMWGIHQSQLSWGGRCTLSCPCLNHWETAFLPICTGEKKKRKSQMHRGGGERTPKKTSPEDIIRYRPSDEALGFYCISRGANNNIRSRECVLLSVDPNRSIKSEYLQPGMTIEAFCTGKPPEWKTVRSHLDVKKVYNALKTTGKRLQIKFKKSPDSNGRICSKDWRRGAWIGKATNGWAGGAAVSNTVTEDTASDKSVSAIHRKTGRLVAANQESSNVSMREKIARQNEKSTTISRTSNSLPSQNMASQQKSKSTIYGIAGSANISTNVLDTASDSVRATVAKIPASKSSILRQPSRRCSVPSSKKIVNFKSNISQIYFIESRRELYEQGVLPSDPHKEYKKLRATAKNGPISAMLTRIQQETTTCQNCTALEKEITKHLQNLESENEKMLLISTFRSDSERQRSKAQNDAFIRMKNELEMKKKLVKIYSKALLILAKMQDIDVKSMSLDAIHKAMGDVSKWKKDIKELDRWIKKFKTEADIKHISIPLKPNMQKSGLTLLHAAVFIGESDLAKRLIDNGAESRNHEDFGTPLELATYLLKKSRDEERTSWILKFKAVEDRLKSSRRLS